MKESLQYSHVQMVFITLTTVLFSGIFLNDYLLKIGFGPFHFGLLYAINFTAGLIAMPFSFHANKVVRKRAFFIKYTMFYIGFYALFTVTPYLPFLSPEAVIYVSIFSLGSATILNGIGYLVLIPWLYRIAGSAVWGKFFTFRLIVFYAVAIVCTLGFGLLLDGAGLHTSTMLFAIGLLAGVIYLLISRLIPENPGISSESRPAVPIGRLVASMATDRGYIGLLLHIALLAAGLGMFTPLVYPYLLAEVGISSANVSYYQTLMMLASVIALLFASKLTERVGNLKVLLLVMSMVWLIPFMLLLVPYVSPMLSYVIFAMGVMESYGFILVVVYVAFMNLTLAYAPADDNTVYLAVINFVKAIFLSIGSLVGGIIAKGNAMYAFAGMQVSGTQIVFMCAIAFFLAAFVCLVVYKPLLEARRVEAPAESLPASSPTVQAAHVE